MERGWWKSQVNLNLSAKSNGASCCRDNTRSVDTVIGIFLSAEAHGAMLIARPGRIKHSQDVRHGVKACAHRRHTRRVKPALSNLVRLLPTLGHEESKS